MIKTNREELHPGMISFEISTSIEQPRTIGSLEDQMRTKLNEIRENDSPSHVNSFNLPLKPLSR